MERIDELMKVVNNNTPTTDRHYIELMMLSDLVEKYENDKKIKKRIVFPKKELPLRLQLQQESA